MRFRYGALVFVAAACAAGGVPGDPAITLPAPPAVPAPAPAPGAALTLSGDALYVADSRVDVVVRDHPKGLVRVTKEAGPIRIRARFVDGKGGVESRTYAGPHVILIEAVGKGRVEIDFVPLGLKAEADIASAVVDVDAGQGAQPPPCPDPKPDPKPDPNPKPDPKPRPLDGLAWVVVIEETAARTVETARVLNDTAYWLGLKAKGVSWRFYDKDSPDLAGRGYDGYVDPATGKRVAYADTIGLPYVLFLGKDGKRLALAKLPATTAGIDAVISGGKP